jgi:hypothetical protein
VGTTAVTPVRIRDFDIALSFAGEDRAYVDQLANLLRSQGVKVFYDLFEEADLWGKDLYEHLSDVYQSKARFTVMFISSHYADKLWTRHERKAAQARAFQESQEYILPVRFDDTEIPGVLHTVGYISLKEKSPAELASLITKKLISSGATIPSEAIRRNFSRINAVPRAAPVELKVTILDDEGRPIPAASVTCLADNNTTLNGQSDANGVVTIAVQTRRSYKLLVAHPDFPALLLDRIDPAESYDVVMPRAENIGSIIVHDTGTISGMAGHINPICDPARRMYLYARNIAINGGQLQPVTFSINEPIELEDCNGNVFLLTFKLISGQTSLVQFLKPPIAP